MQVQEGQYNMTNNDIHLKTILDLTKYKTVISHDVHEKSGKQGRWSPNQTYLHLKIFVKIQNTQQINISGEGYQGKKVKVDPQTQGSAEAYLLFVTDTTDGVCVKKIARCKFLQI